MLKRTGFSDPLHVVDIIFIKPEINTGDIGDRRDSRQLKNKKETKKNRQSRHLGLYRYRLIRFHS
jgi:hypothetical protein